MPMVSLVPPRSSHQLLAALTFLIFCGDLPAAHASEADLYVSTHGKDTWSGRLPAPSADGVDGPLATLDAARRRVTELRKHEPERNRPVLVALRGGTYFLDRPLKFDPTDSGTPSSPTVYAAYANERPIISGGMAITNWHVTADGRWHAPLPGDGAEARSFSQIFVDDELRERTRLPAAGWYRVAADAGRNQFGFSGTDIRADWENLRDVEVLVLHKWSASRMGIASVATNPNNVVLAGRAWRAFEAGNRYAVFNVLEALSQPGQWYHDRKRKALTYIPKAGEVPEKTQVIVPRLDNIVVMKGDVQAKRWVEQIVFRGLSFAHTSWQLPAEGQSFAQAEIGLDAAIVAIGVRNVTFEDCEVRHTGGYAMGFGIGSRDNRVDGCRLSDLGGGGIKVGHAGPGSWDRIAQIPNDPELLVSGHVIHNSTISRGGRLHPAAVGIWVGQAANNKITHNEVFDFYQTGISIGWTWGYGRSEARHNEIAYNHIHTIGQEVLSDMGGIYLLGIQPGTRVHHNRVNGVRSADYGGWGIYADEGTSDVLIDNNVVYETTSGAFHQHFGRGNRVENNILAFGSQAQIQLTRAERHVSFILERNIVYWDSSAPVFGGCLSWQTPCTAHITSDRNIYWRTGGQPPAFPGTLTLDAWRRDTGQDLNSRNADPLFASSEQRDFTIHSGSPAIELGFKPIDLSRVGPSADR